METRFVGELQGEVKLKLIYMYAKNPKIFWEKQEDQIMMKEKKVGDVKSAQDPPVFTNLYNKLIPFSFFLM